MNIAPRPDRGFAVDSALLWTLRLGVICCFVGHGALGLNQTAAWESYFAVAGIAPKHALGLMPWVGSFDLIMAMSVLFIPTRGVVLYMAGWALWTALLRPLAGEPFWEAVERAGNYGAPLALFLLFAGGRALKDWFPGRFRETIDASLGRTLGWTLRLTVVLLLLGHGMLNWIVHKPMFATQYNLLGLPGSTVEPMVGVFECVLALAVLIRPGRALLLGVLAWKVATEALNPMAGSPFWVFIEHGGSYAAPLALLFLLPKARVAPATATAPAR